MSEQPVEDPGLDTRRATLHKLQRLYSLRAEHSPLRASFDRSLVTILIAGGLFIFLLTAMLPLHGPAGAVLMLFPVNLAIYLCAGVLAWYRRPSNNMGALILLAGLAVFLGGAGNADNPVFVLLGTLTASVPLAVFIHLLLAFPTGRLSDPIDRLAVSTAYTTALLLQIPLYLFDENGPMPALAIVHEPELAQLGAGIQGAVGSAAFLLTAARLIYRMSRASYAELRVLVPLYSYGVIAIMVILFSNGVLGAMFGWGGELIAMLQLLVFAGVPIAFALGALRGGVARTGELEELGAWLGAAGDEKPALDVALARALGDPSLEVWFWMSARSIFVNTQGDEVSVAWQEPHRGVEIVTLDGRRIGAIAYDATLIVDKKLAHTAGRVVAIALDRERLTAELHASRRALQLSRERLVEAADAERSRIAQDLHDGIQVQLVLLGLEAQQLSDPGRTSTSLAERATTLRKGIDAAATELRELVHSVMPAALMQRGLSAAAEDLVDRMPIPTTLDLGVSDGDCPQVVERIAYFVVAEALANAVKYSNARSIVVRLRRRGECLLVEIVDDGDGGARPNAGSGLRGMAERVDVLGGTLQVQSEPGQGTRITVEVPCGS